MFPELQDYGLIFLLLAVFGFIVLDIFKTGQQWGIPNFYKSNIEIFFHYVSTAILVLSFIFVLIGLALSSPNPDNVITKFIIDIFNIFDKIHELGLISDGSIMMIGKILVFSTFFAFLYIFLYFVVFYLGVYFRISSAIQLNVFLKDNQSNHKKFSGLITETDDFFFFLKNEGINLWEAVRKDDIAGIETIKGRPRLDNWIFGLIIWIKKIVNKLRLRLKKQKNNIKFLQNPEHPP